MSKFSGKCDLYDSLIDIRELDDSSDWSKIKIYQIKHEDDGTLSKVLLKIECIKDLVPYYPFIESFGSGSDGTFTAHIGSHSFIYTEEQERLSWALRDARREYKKCKRENRSFVPEDVAKKISPFSSDDYVLQICERVKEHPYSTNLRNIHTYIHMHYRKELMKEMIKNGYSQDQALEWCMDERKTW